MTFRKCCALALQNAGYRRCYGGCRQWLDLQHFSSKANRCQFCTYQHSQAAYRRRLQSQADQAQRTIDKLNYSELYDNSFAL